MPWLIIESKLSFGFKTIRYLTLEAAPKVDKTHDPLVELEGWSPVG
jgi:hypothetical protein